MMIRALLINLFSQFNSKKVEEVQLAVNSDNTLDLEVLYRLLDCDLVKFVYNTKDQQILIVDEEGLLKSEQDFFKLKGFGQEVFAGKALIVKYKDDVDNVINLSKEEIKKLTSSTSFLSRKAAYKVVSNL